MADSVAFERAKRRMAVILNQPALSVLERLVAGCFPGRAAGAEKSPPEGPL